MALSYTISSLTFSDGSQIVIEPDSIVIFVGPNNAGKTAALKEIENIIKRVPFTPLVVKSLTEKREGTSEELFTWILIDSTQVVHAPGNIMINKLKYQTWLPNITNSIQHWSPITKQVHPNTGDPGMQEVGHLLCYRLSTEDRLSSANPADTVSMTEGAIQHPIQRLFRDDKFEIKLSEDFHRAFGMDLIVHRTAGNKIPLYCGQRPVPKEGDDRASYNYAIELEKLPKLHEQGDGMRSFVGTLLYTSVINYFIFLMDEPEAFLHPPQARIVGLLMAKRKAPNCQFFIATHSSDFIKGIIDHKESSLKIIRIQRTGSINKVKELDKDKIKELWRDPLLRFSNILDGLFHEMVIVCEADSDCRFYSAMTHSMADTLARSGQNLPDIMFTHCGGKDRLPVVVKSLRAIEVPTRVIADFDILNNEEPLKSVVQALDGDWSRIETLWKQVKSAIETKFTSKPTSEVVENLKGILASIKERVFPESAATKIKEALPKTSAWASAKQSGKSAIPHGDAVQKYQELVKELNLIGLYIAECGELECFVPSVGGHGPAWVNAVLTRKLETDAELQDAREFIKKVTDPSIKKT